MTPKQQLLKELENTPTPLVTAVLNFLRFLKAKQPPTDFAEFAGIAADDYSPIDNTIENAERDRQPKRKPGLHPDAFVISDDFNEPLLDSFWLGEE
ncbi:DUF2281 domain-containing protein [Leptolyngbya sp. BC1307]|uniref:DUF2281 domain-containing protein n=1 Tax=Leptolyngbya sp. BC1307 TaxID=2029589 RepID=UPI000EFD251B|nr:DUF2281 domain-containing protein [Leptolyngbya sp. BC1307]